MANEYFAAQRAGVAEGIAREAGCDPVCFDRELLTIVRRPEPPAWQYSAMLATFGTGTVLSVEPAYLEWVHSHLPKKHYRAFSESFLAPLVAEAARHGTRLSAHTGAIGFALSRPPVLEPIIGYHFEYAGPDWMATERASGLFHNALGAPAEDYRTNQYRFAILAHDDAGALAAVAGVFDTTGLFEIGVDVERRHRGNGLANAVVARAAAATLEAGETPFYSCGATNIRSQRTALSCGFLPVCSMGYVAPAETDLM